VTRPPAAAPLENPAPGPTLKERLEPAMSVLTASALLLVAVTRTITATRTHYWPPVTTGWLFVLAGSLPCLLTFAFGKRLAARNEGKVPAEEKTPQAKRKERRAAGWMIAIGLVFCVCGTGFTSELVRSISRPDLSLFLKVLSVNALAIFWPAQVWWLATVAAYVGEACRARKGQQA